MRGSREVEASFWALLMAWGAYHILRLFAEFKPRHPSATQIAADTAGTGNPPGA